MINLTQHRASGEQIAAGVVDVDGPQEQEALRGLLTFDSLPTGEEVAARAAAVANMAADHGATSAMIGGALWLMAPLAKELRARGITPLFAFSARESAEENLPDGSVRKVQVFRHKGFVEAL